MFEKTLSIFSAVDGQSITIFPHGQPFTDLKVDCYCGHPRSDVNRLPRDLCPKCGSHIVVVKIKGINQ